MKQRLRTFFTFLCISLCFDAIFAADTFADDTFSGGMMGGLMGGMLNTKESIHSAVQFGPGKVPERKIMMILQQKLQALSLYDGEIDGIAGPQTKEAIKKFQISIGGEPSGILSAPQTSALNLRYLSVVNTGNGGIGADWRPIDNLTHPSAYPTSFQVGEIYASRLFAGPNEYPPTEFAAYGLVAFKAVASSRDRDRHVMICEVYMASIRSEKELDRERSEQMVTVWPIRDDKAAADLTALDDKKYCGQAVDDYGILKADRAIREARLAGADVDGIGPYLLAWSPPAKKGAPDAIVLIADLSEVMDYNQALQVMSDWVRDIERDPQLWTHGWTLDALRLKIQHWADRRGTQLLTAVGGVQ